MKEEWRDIAGYEGLYKISNLGRVKSFKNNSEKLLKPGCGIYLAVFLYKNGKRIRRNIHRLVAKTFIENPENKPHVNHKDSDKHNNKVSNLEWCTQKENIDHAIKMDNFTIGEKNGLAKFTNKEVSHIRSIYVPYHSKFGGKALAKKYQVSKKTMHLILNNVTYVDVE